jgi:RecA-family ATPase
MSDLSYVAASELGNQTAPTWLIEGLWLEQAVGIIGGEPKCFKTFLGLDLAIAIASGTAALGHYTVNRPGPVLIYAAEDAHSAIYQRLKAAASARDFKLEDLPINVITVASLQIDTSDDQAALSRLVAALKPCFLLLDPFVRLHSGDENVSSEVAKVLAFLRTINRTYGTAIAVVHHARKKVGRSRPGQNLRGSSEFHAWGDCNLYLIRHPSDKATEVRLTVEHRSAAGHDEQKLLLVSSPGEESPTLCYDDANQELNEPQQQAHPHDRILEVLRHQQTGCSITDLRSLAHMRHGLCKSSLDELLVAKRITLDANLYKIVN